MYVDASLIEDGTYIKAAAEDAGFKYVNGKLIKMLRRKEEEEREKAENETRTDEEAVQDEESGVQFSLRITTDGRPVAVVDDDILSGIYTGKWDKATADKAKKAAKTALLKFKGGISVKGITAKVNKTSRDEYTRSDYSEALRNHDPDAYADKLRAASVADDVVIAATNRSRDGGLTHSRKDDFVDFDRGQTLIMSGTNQYSAVVIVGITDKGEFVFYDVEDMKPTAFDIKSERDLPAVTPDEPFDAMLKVSNDVIITDPQQEINPSEQNSSEKVSTSGKPQFSLPTRSASDTAYLDAVKRGDMEAAQRTVNEAARRAQFSLPAKSGLDNAVEEGYNGDNQNNAKEGIYYDREGTPSEERGELSQSESDNDGVRKAAENRSGISGGFREEAERVRRISLLRGYAGRNRGRRLAFGKKSIVSPESDSVEYYERNTVQEYGIDCFLIKKDNWDRDSLATSTEGVVYIREGLSADVLNYFRARSYSRAIQRGYDRGKATTGGQ